MIRIGIVGDIGCGKTYVANKFGYPVFNADKEVEKLYKNDRNCFRKLNKALPKFINSFPISKKAISLAIQKNEFNLKKIVKIVHPIIRKKMNKFLIKNKKKNNYFRRSTSFRKQNQQKIRYNCFCRFKKK